MGRVRSFITSHGEQGQMLLVVVLTMIVALTVGLSVVSRTITSLKISKEGEESQRAFQAAEAGIEKQLQSGSTGSLNSSLLNNAKYSTSVPSGLNSGTSFLLNAGDQVTQDTGIDVALGTYPTYANPYTGTMTVYWNPNSQSSCSHNAGANTASALEVNVISGTFNAPQTTPQPTAIPTNIPTATPTPLPVTLAASDSFDSTANSTTCISGDDSPHTRSVGKISTSNFYRATFKFDLSSIPAGSTITNVSLKYNVQVAGSNGVAIAPYNGTGTSDPDSASCATLYARSKPSTSYTTSSVVNSTGSHTYTFTSSQRSDVQDAINGGFFALAFNEGTSSGANFTATISNRYNSGTKPVLNVTYIPRAGAIPTPTRTPTPTPTAIPFAPSLTLTKTVYDPCSGRTSGATTPGGTGTVAGTTFNNSVAIPLTSGLISKITPLYGSSIVGVTGTVALPSQGTIVDSTGTSEQTVRKVRYFSSNPQIPAEIFPYSILSQ